MKRTVKRHAVAQPPDPSYRYIALPRNLNAIVSSEDFEFLSQWNWSVGGKGPYLYAMRNGSRPRRKLIAMHRVVMQRTNGDAPLQDALVDHISGDTLDNRRSNLRICTKMQNQWNQKRNSANTSGFKGVTKVGKKWRARLGNKNLGYFDTAEEAHAIWAESAQNTYGEFARMC